MATLIVYSTLTGNTKAVCERIHGALNGEKKIVDLKNIKEENLDLYENIIVGFWCDKGTMDVSSIKFVESLKNKNLYFMGTLGARPNSDHWKDVFERAKALCCENNNYKDGLLIWGKLSQAVMDKIRSLPAGHGHGINPERLKRWEDASTHPDENDFKQAEEFFSKLLNKE